MTVRAATRAAAVAAPLLVLGTAALVLAVTGFEGSVLLTIPVPTLLATVGAVGTAAVLAVAVVRPRARARRRRERDEAAEVATARERSAHRRFLQRLDHELKNPVTAIRSALAAGDPVPARNVRIAAGQARRVGDLVGQLRALSSLETRELERLPVELGPLVEEEVAALREELAARGARRELRTVLPTVPWPLPPVLGDGDLLRVMLRNLLVNAVKYADDGSAVEVRGSEARGRVELEVADTGWGIRAEDLPHVWEELWRSTDARTVDGTGLGLNLVRVIAVRHGGDVELGSVHGRGTRVRVTLPASTPGR
ncbi:sensor histidine kinase [Brachybacterium sp. AOP25-B2-12]|uniref:sensor histidine kinase n=1 Tax=Brachybacterium sp. AOP25-B2-12 TaxID=3457710 RepID=UPI00403413C6